MKTHNLHNLFNPKNIAVIGASNKPLKVGGQVFANLQTFKGKVFPVNPKHKKIHGVRCYANVNEIFEKIDMAIIVTPAKIVPQIIAECGKKTINTAIILSAGFREVADGKKLEQQIIDLANFYKLSFIGPNCLGIRRPAINLNATFEDSSVKIGNLAFVSQSGALCAAILDWAYEEKIGFSAVVSIGNSADIGFGEILDYLAIDPKTDCILLYIEGVSHAKNFVEGLRRASKLKPVIAIKAGRNVQGSKAALSHTGALIGSDDVFDAILRQAGVLRVLTVRQLFAAAQIFAAKYCLHGDKVTIITNGGGAGVMAADSAADLKLKLAPLSKPTMAKLNTVLPKSWSHNNPIDILGDATPARYQQVIDICLADNNCYGLIVILVPVSMSQPLEAAKQIVKQTKKHDKPIIVCWMGKGQVKTSWELFAKHNIPCFSTPESALKAFSYLVTFRSNQKFLQQDKSFSTSIKPDLLAVKKIIQQARQDKRLVLTMLESKNILAAFQIPITKAILARSAKEALKAANLLGYPVAMKIYSPSITHKQDVGGIQLNIVNSVDIETIFNQLIANAKRSEPEVEVIGVTVEPMYKNFADRELMLGIIKDPVFGPAINFGAGGSLVEIIHDRSIAIPPLNNYLIENLINHSKISKLLNAFRNKPAINFAALKDILKKFSALACTISEIKEMDINPLIANDKEVIALDARIVLTDKYNLTDGRR